MTPNSRFTLPRHPEHQYLDLLRELLDAEPRATRNDTATRSLFGRQMRFDLGKHGFPLLTTKRVFWKGVVAELLWMLSGSTNVRPLQDQGVSIWDEWADLETGDLGPIYGYQMRQWTGVVQDSEGCVEDVRVIDQVADVLKSLRTDPHGRRHVMTLWNPGDLPDMALPPCHGVAIQFYVGDDERLSLAMYQRSADAFLGLPFNIASYALLLEMFAAVLDRQPGEFVWMGGDVHLYGNHVEQAQQQVLREPRSLPRLRVLPRPDMDTWQSSDIRLDAYDPWPAIPAEVSA